MLFQSFPSTFFISFYFLSNSYCFLSISHPFTTLPHLQLLTTFYHFSSFPTIFTISSHHNSSNLFPFNSSGTKKPKRSHCSFCIFSIFQSVFLLNGLAISRNASKRSSLIFTARSEANFSTTITALTTFGGGEKLSAFTVNAYCTCDVLLTNHRR